jgi:putative FmdB family regulatory protein
MPLYDYRCPVCNYQEELLVPAADCMVACVSCAASLGRTVFMTKLPSAVSFKIKGYRAANAYGQKFIDTPGKSPVTGEESGCSFTSNRGGTVDHNLGGASSAFLGSAETLGGE